MILFPLLRQRVLFLFIHSNPSRGHKHDIAKMKISYKEVRLYVNLPLHLVVSQRPMLPDPS